VKAKGPATVPALHVGDIIRRHNGKSGTHSNTYSKPHSYTYTNTHSINYSRAQSDSQASPHATSSPAAAMIPHLSDSSPPKRASEAKGSYYLRSVIVE